MPSPLARLVFVLAAAVAAGCSSHSDEVCEDVAECEESGSSSFLASCQRDAKLLGGEADGVGCRPAFDDSYRCAAAAFVCTGATASFPGCDGKLAALDACLAAATAGTSCVALTTRENACPAGPAPAPAPALPAACTGRRDCEAQCYLASAADVCAPGVGELDAFEACAAACPPDLP
jgi:hypothetical protein